MTDLLPSTRAANLAVWALTATALLGWGIVTGRSHRLPSIGDVVHALGRWLPLRWTMLAAWGWLGWHLFVRTSF